GGEGERLEQRDHHRHRDRDPELEEELPDDPLHEGHGQEDGDDREARGRGGERDLARAYGGGAHPPHPLLAAAVDVLEDHDRVVDHYAHDEGEAEDGERVEREAEYVHHDESPQDRRGYGEQHVQRGGPRAEEDPADEAGEDGGEDEREEDLPDRLLHEDRGVPVHEEGQAFGQALRHLRDLRVHRAPHLDGVRTAQLGHAEAHGGLAHRSADAAAVLEAVFHHRDVLETDGSAVAVGHDEVAEGREVDRLALGLHVHLPLRGLDASRRDLEVLAGDGGVDVLRGEALGLHPRRVVPHAHRAVAEALELYVAHPRDRLDLGLDV